jgi:hypothetical protein
MSPDGDGTFVIDEAGGVQRTLTRRTVDGRITEHVERRDANNQVIQTGDRTTFTDADGNVRVDSTSTSRDPQTGESRAEERHETRFVHDAADGRHPAGSAQTTVHEVQTDASGNTVTIDGTEERDAEGNFSRTDSAVDSTSGMTAVTTTTTDANGDGTRHTTLVDASGDPVLDQDGNPVQDETLDIHETPDPGHQGLFQ